MDGALSDATIRAFAPGDEGGINASFNRAFGLRRAVADWFWKFPAEPLGRFIWVAVDGSGEVLAHYAAVPAVMQVDGRRVVAGQGVDAFAVPECQGQRLYSRTAQAFHETYGGEGRLEVCYVFPGLRSARIFADRLGFERLAEPAVWRRSLARRTAWWSGHEVVAAAPDERLDGLWRAAAPRYPVAVMRDAAWLKRRFTGRPGVDYLHVAAVRGGEVHAWAVLRVEAQRVAWAELVWDGERGGALAALDRVAVELARRAGVGTLEMWLEGDEAAAVVFRRLGWRRQPPPAAMLLMARSFTPAVPTAALRRLYVTMGDADLV